MAFTFRRAVREDVRLVLGIAGASGSGKTYSAMRLAQGIAGDKPFALVDTENGRALHYADSFLFDHATLKPPFTPAAYTEALEAADLAGYPVIVVDQMSHEHAGEGGLLDMHEAELQRMAGDDWKRRDVLSMAAWVRPKAEHKRFMQKLLMLKAHVILLFRAEQKIEMVKKDGKLEVVPKKILSGFSDWIPIAEKNLLYELTASFLLVPDKPGIPIPIKLESQHRPFFPLDKELDEGAGALLAAWASGGVPYAEAPGAMIPVSKENMILVGNLLTRWRAMRLTRKAVGAILVAHNLPVSLANANADWSKVDPAVVQDLLKEAMA